MPQIGVMLPNLVVKDGDREVGQIRPGFARCIEDGDAAGKHLGCIAIDRRRMPLIGAAKKIRYWHPARGQHLAVNRGRARSVEPTFVAHLVAIFGEEPGEWLVFAAKIAGEVLRWILLPHIPLAVVHETQRPSGCGPRPAEAAQRAFVRVPIGEVIAGVTQHSDAVADRRR